MDTPALPQELIRAKRDGRALDREAIAQLVAGISDGSLSEAQVDSLGARETFADFGQSLAHHLGLAPMDDGTAFLDSDATGGP